MTLLDRFGLSAQAKSRIDQLSKGMSQKVQLATALVNKPRLLILDEPFSGLDPLNQGLLEDEIVAAARGGATVVFSTHVMQHAERLCDRLLLLARGVKRFEGTQDEARATMPLRLTITPGTPETLYEEGCLSFPKIRGDILRQDDITVKFQDERGVPHILKCNGLLARCIQHEVDHLNGVLFIDRMEKKTRTKVDEAVKDLAKETRAVSKK